MNSVLNFVSSLSTEQWSIVLGVVALVGHTLLRLKSTALGKDINKFIVRFLSVVVPIGTVVATDPNVQGIVHNYLPTLAAFFTTYQGLYFAVDALLKKVASLKAALPVAEPTQEQSF